MKFPAIPFPSKAIVLALIGMAGNAAALTATSFFPANNATSVCADTPLKITFDAPPAIGTEGAVRIYNSGGTLAGTLDLAVPDTRTIAARFTTPCP